MWYICEVAVEKCSIERKEVIDQNQYLKILYPSRARLTCLAYWRMG